MDINFIQTSDPRNYIELYKITSSTVINYCTRKDYKYEAFIGLKRGTQPWHATYNRIVMLREMVQNGCRSWVCYMDADAFISNLDFDLEAYLKDKTDFAMIVAHSGVMPPAYWQVNAGVILFNLAHFAARQIIEDWFIKFNEIPLEKLTEIPWENMPNDQDILQNILKENIYLERFVHLEEGENCVINTDNALFIRQVLRANGNMRERLEQARRATAHTFKSDKVEQTSYLQEDTALEVCGNEIITALYRALLLREADPGGLQHSLRMYLNSGCNVESVARILLSSEEFAMNVKNFLAKYVSVRMEDLC